LFGISLKMRKVNNCKYCERKIESRAKHAIYCKACFYLVSGIKYSIMGHVQYLRKIKPQTKILCKITITKKVKE